MAFFLGFGEPREGGKGMNKTLLMILTIQAAVAGFFDLFKSFDVVPSSRTPRIHHRTKNFRIHAKAPNDGHWHMKHHRNRH